MKKLKIVLQVVIVLFSSAFALLLIVQSLDYMRYYLGYGRARDALLMAYIKGEGVEDMQSATAYLHATANMRMSDLKESFLKGSAGLLMLVSSFVPVYLFDRQERPSTKKREEAVIPYANEGEILYDDRKLPEVH